MKRTLSLVISILIAFTCFCSNSFAAEVYDNNTEIINNIEKSSLSEDLPGPEEELTGETIVARVYLCATVFSLTGHVWLYVVNLTDWEIPLGYITMMPHEEMSVGSLRNTRYDGGGTYYNGEAYMANHSKSAATVKSQAVAMYTDITYNQLLVMNNKIRSHNTYILLGYNCGDFACVVWNSICPAGKNVINLLVPAPTILIMLLLGGSTGVVEMKDPDPSRCFKQVSGGVKQASISSFSVSCI